jgi:hypothetical protein
VSVDLRSLFGNFELRSLPFPSFLFGMSVNNTLTFVWIMSVRNEDDLFIPFGKFERLMGQAWL